MLSECAAATLILGSQTKTAVVQLNMSELMNDQNQARTKTQDYDQVIYGNIQGQILYEIDHCCKFSYLYHANLLFTDLAVYKLVQGQTKPEPILSFETKLTALLRINTDTILGVDEEQRLRLFTYQENEQNYVEVGKELLSCL